MVCQHSKARRRRAGERRLGTCNVRWRWSFLRIIEAETRPWWAQTAARPLPSLLLLIPLLLTTRSLPTEILSSRNLGQQQSRAGPGSNRFAREPFSAPSKLLFSIVNVPPSTSTNTKGQLHRHRIVVLDCASSKKALSTLFFSVYL